MSVGAATHRVHPAAHTLHIRNNSGDPKSCLLAACFWCLLQAGIPTSLRKTPTTMRPGTSSAVSGQGRKFHLSLVERDGVWWHGEATVVTDIPENRVKITNSRPLGHHGRRLVILV